MAATRAYFAEEHFIEVDTPALQISPGMEPHLSAFATTYVTPRGETRRLYLATSPEFACKKLLVAGMQRIYQLSHVFRNNEDSSRHHPEFTMLEWYRVNAGYVDLMEDCLQLLRRAATLSGQGDYGYGGRFCDIFAPPVTLTVQEAFEKFLELDLLATIDDPQNPQPEKLRKEAASRGVRVAADDGWDDIALRLLGEKIEPHLGVGRICFLTDYPLCMAALARPKPSDLRVAERFELYVCGLELANAFIELTDPVIQRARFETDQKLKETRYGVNMPIDEDFLAALEHGMPQAAGIALGFDRLVMLATGNEDINDVLWAPVAGTQE